MGRINREVYDLVKIIEKHRDDKIRNVKRLDKRRAELKNLKEKNENKDTDNMES